MLRKRLSTRWNATSIRQPRYGDGCPRLLENGLDLIVVQGRPRLKKAIADAYSASFGRQLDPDTEVTITTGANEGWFEIAVVNKLDARADQRIGMLCAFMAFIEPGDEVIVFEPFFDQSVSASGGVRDGVDG